MGRRLAGAPGAGVLIATGGDGDGETRAHAAGCGRREVHRDVAAAVRGDCRGTRVGADGQAGLGGIQADGWRTGGKISDVGDRELLIRGGAEYYVAEAERVEV